MVVRKEEKPSVQERGQTRLEELREELEKGQAELQKVDAYRASLHETILRISGAVQALEELLSEGEEAPEHNGAAPSEGRPATALREGADA